MITDLEKEKGIKLFFKTELDKGRILDWGQFYDYISQQDPSIELLDKVQKWFNNILEVKLLDDVPNKSEEVFIHSADSCFIKNYATTSVFEHDFIQEDIDLTLNYLSIKNGQNWNYLNPYVSFNVSINKHSYRATFIHYSLNPEKVNKAFFRILNKEPIDLKKYNYSNKLSELVKQKKNILIAGSTGCGKSTLLNSLLAETKDTEHIVILEDTYELRSPNERTSRLLSGHKKLDELLSYCLRMSPDRIILGEIRAREVLTYILGMNTGHKGMISSIHANTAKDALSRMAILYATYAPTKMNYEMILKLICSNIDYVVYIENKKIKEIIEVFGSEGSNVFYDTAV